MKRVILAALLCAPMCYAADYRQEIMEQMINPCFKQTMKREGLNADDSKLLDMYIKNFGGQIMDNVEFLQTTLERYPMSYPERQELYRIGLNSCLQG